MLNVVALRGTVVKPAEVRVLRSGDRVVELDVRIEREDEPAETVPVVAHDAVDRVAALVGGAEVVVVGRVRRRFFRSGGATVSRTEVVAEEVVAVRQRKRVAAALTVAAERVRRCA